VNKRSQSGGETIRGINADAQEEEKQRFSNGGRSVNPTGAEISLRQKRTGDLGQASFQPKESCRSETESQPLKPDRSKGKHVQKTRTRIGGGRDVTTHRKPVHTVSGPRGNKKRSQKRLRGLSPYRVLELNNNNGGGGN